MFIFFLGGGWGGRVTVNAGSKPMDEEKIRVPPWELYMYLYTFCCFDF